MDKIETLKELSEASIRAEEVSSKIYDLIQKVIDSIIYETPDNYEILLEAQKIIPRGILRYRINEEIKAIEKQMKKQGEIPS